MIKTIYFILALVSWFFMTRIDPHSFGFFLSFGVGLVFFILWLIYFVRGKIAKVILWFRGPRG